MTDDTATLSELAEHELPFGRRVRLLDVDYHNGLHMLRLIWREGTRITQIDIDATSADLLANGLKSWATAHKPDADN